MLRKISLDICDAREGDFDVPSVSFNHSNPNMEYRLQSCWLVTLIYNCNLVVLEPLFSSVCREILPKYCEDCKMQASKEHNRFSRHGGSPDPSAQGDIGVGVEQ